MGPRGGTATVLFSDLVGSTELLTRLGEAGFDELRRAHFAVLRAAIDDAGGNEVKTLGDGVLAVFGSAAGALSCAVAMQQGVARQAEKLRVPLAIRVGLALGEVSFEEDDVFGTPVVEAARLVATARGGQILATAVVAAVAGPRTDARFTDLGGLELKGLPSPVATCEVAWDPCPPHQIPVPALMTGTGRVFVGRQAALDRLQQLWKTAAGGDRRIALVAGEPGVGKTRLAAELARAAHAEGATVLAGRCDEDLGVPYQPFVEALRYFAGHTAPKDLPGRLGRHAGELVRLVPELADACPGLPPPLRSDPETERYRLFDAVGAWLAAVSEETPVLLVLDDLQWATKPTLLLFRHVAGSTEPLRLLVVGTFRDTELPRRHPLTESLADLRRQDGVERLPLTGLDEAGIGEYLEAAAGHELGDEERLLIRAIHAETEGNPFFVGEVLRHLAETGALSQRDGRWVTTSGVAALGIPEGVRDVVARRLSRLSETADRVLSLAAVAGPEFELAVLRSAAELGEDTLVTALEEAGTARLVAEVAGVPPRYRFAHALVRATLYDDLSLARRAGLHRKVGEAIEAVHGHRLDDHLPALALHFTQAGGTDDLVRAVGYARQAGDRALGQLAHDEAVTHYRQALDLSAATDGPSGDAPRLELLISLGEAERRAGDAAHRETLLQAGRLATVLGDADGGARAALANQRGLFSRYGEVDLERVAALEVALAAHGPADTPTRARLLACLANELYFVGDDRRHALGRQALGVARRLGDPATLAEVLASLWFTTWDPASPDEGAELAAELAELARRLGDPMLEFHAGIALSYTGFHRGDFGRADAGLEACSRIADQLGQPVLRWRVLLARTKRAIAAGRFDDAERYAEEGLRLGESTGQPDSPLLHDAAVAIVRLFQGRGEEAVALGEPHRWVKGADALLAWFYTELNRDDDARVMVEVVRAEGYSHLPRDHMWLFTLSGLSLAIARTADRASAAEVYELLLPHRLEMAQVQTSWLGPVAHYLGLLASTLGRHDDADAHFAAAAEVQERIGALGTLVHTRLEWARMLSARRQPGDLDQARTLLGDARRLAGTLGMTGVVSRVDELSRLS